MKPPRCGLCGRKFDPFGWGPLGGGSVSFRRAEEQKPWPEGMTGHPENVVWFCWPHIRPARRLRRMTRGEALRRLRGWRAVLPF